MNISFGDQPFEPNPQSPNPVVAYFKVLDEYYWNFACYVPMPIWIHYTILFLIVIAHSMLVVVFIKLMTSHFIHEPRRHKEYIKQRVDQINK